MPGPDRVSPCYLAGGRSLRRLLRLGGEGGPLGVGKPFAHSRRSGSQRRAEHWRLWRGGQGHHCLHPCLGPAGTAFCDHRPGPMRLWLPNLPLQNRLERPIHHYCRYLSAFKGAQASPGLRRHPEGPGRVRRGPDGKRCRKGRSPRNSSGTPSSASGTRSCRTRQSPDRPEVSSAIPLSARSTLPGL